eukprot:763637-Amphidinium_carterae.1
MQDLTCASSAHTLTLTVPFRYSLLPERTSHVPQSITRMICCTTTHQFQPHCMRVLVKWLLTFHDVPRMRDNSCVPETVFLSVLGESSASLLQDLQTYTNPTAATEHAHVHDLDWHKAAC